MPEEAVEQKLFGLEDTVHGRKGDNIMFAYCSTVFVIYFMTQSFTNNINCKESKMNIFLSKL
jgi:hypothetical protein